MAVVEDDEQVIARVAALDIGKAEVVCCVRLPAPGGGRRRVQEVTTHSTMVASLTELANRLSPWVMAGHASLATTDKYVRLARNELSAAAAAINAYAAPYMSPYTGANGAQGT